VLEVQREMAAGLDPMPDPIDLAPESDDDELLAAEEIPDAVHGDPETEAPGEPVRIPAASLTQPIPVSDLAEADVAELGLADRLGLGETDPDDEVGPTS
jgi:cell division transport system ATP-binding protein